jgi:hypothetical protein
MKKTTLAGGFALLALSLLLTTAPGAAQTPAPSMAPSSSPAAAATADPKIQALAKTLLHQAQTNTLDHALLTDQMIAALTPDLTKKLADQMGPLGEPTAMTFVTSQSTQGLMVYKFTVAFSAGTITELFGLDAQGKVAGLRFAPGP